MTARFFHVTNADSAEAILQSGFRDGEGNYGHTRRLRGVWISEQPLDANEGALGDTILSVEFPDGTDLSDYELVEFRKDYRVDDRKGYREWCVPASLINGVATVEKYEPPVESDEEAIMSAIRYQLTQAVVEAMHFNIPEEESTPAKFMLQIHGADRGGDYNRMKKAADDAVNSILGIMNSFGFRAPRAIEEPE